MKKLFLIPVVILFACSAYAKDVTVAWEYTGDESFVSWFNIYDRFGESDVYGDPVVSPDPTEREATITISDEDGCTYLVMDAYNDFYGYRSNRSEEVAVCIEGGVVVFPTISLPAPTITKIRVTD